jgi:hypothetical protein
LVSLLQLVEVSLLQLVEVFLPRPVLVSLLQLVFVLQLVWFVPLFFVVFLLLEPGQQVELLVSFPLVGLTEKEMMLSDMLYG